MRVGKRYTEEFRESAVELLKRTDRSFEQVAVDLGVSSVSLRDWYKKRTMAKKKGKRPPDPSVKALQADETPEQKLARLERENAALRRENDSLKMDREILKKAAAHSTVRCIGGLKGDGDGGATTTGLLDERAR